MAITGHTVCCQWAWFAHTFPIQKPKVRVPELMQGAQALMPKIDVYAFGICCIEILTKGALPWPLMDNDAVRRFALSA